MTLILDEEHRFLKRTARDFLQTHAPVDAFRRLRDCADDLRYDPVVWKMMCDLGWASMTLAERHGGLGFGHLGLGVVMEEAGRTLTPSPLLATVGLGATILEMAGNEEQKQTLLRLVAEGELTLALAVDEGHHHDPTGVRLVAQKEAGGYVLSGSKAFVIDGHTADRIILVARTSGSAGEATGLTMFLLDGSTPGLARTPLSMVDSRGYAHLHFDRVSVPDDALLGQPDAAWPVLESVLDRGRVLLASEMLGGVQELFDRTIAYLKERQQFGVPIGSFQALQHRTAGLFSELEMTRSVVLDALSAIDDDRPDLPEVASLAKARMNDLYELVSNEAVQMHGGIGVTDELDIGLFLKRARTSIQLLGDTGFHVDRYARLRGY